MKKKVFLLMVVLIMLVLWTLFRVVLSIPGFSEWFVYFPPIPFIFSLICLFDGKESSNYKYIIVMTIALLLSIPWLSHSGFEMTSTYMYRALSILAGSAVAMATSYLVNKID